MRVNKTNKDKLRRLVLKASENLNQIQKIVGRSNIVDARVKFPRGYFRTTDQTRKLLPVTYGIFDETKIRNICYSLQMADLLRWLAIRTDLDGMLLSQVVKEFICIHGHAIDYILTASSEELGLSVEEKPFKKRSSALVAARHIEPETKRDIDWIWDIRCREHPDKLDDLETTYYRRSDANRARKIFEDFCEEVGKAVIFK